MTDVQIGLLVALLLLAILIMAIWPRRSLPIIEKRLDVLDGTLHGLSDRVAATERDLLETNHSLAQVRQIISGLPTREEVHKLALNLGELRGHMEAIDRSTQATQRTVETIDRYIRKIDQ